MSEEGVNKTGLSTLGNVDFIKSKDKRKVTKQESLKEFLVLKDEKGDVISLEDEGLDDVIYKDESELTDDERMHLYEKAMHFRGLGSNNHALLCFLGCLKGLKHSTKSSFTMLPQCLTHISEIYALAGDYQRAVEFMQGTKLYYETAIIEAGLQVDKYKEKSEESYSPLDFDPCLDEAKRANEYERLANSCLEQKKFQLALEYCGKATKLRQKAYGDEHPLTVKSLDLFTLIYAEMGKSQYSEAMSKVGDIVKELREERERKEEESKENIGEQIKTKPENEEKEGTIENEIVIENSEKEVTNIEPLEQVDANTTELETESNQKEKIGEPKKKKVSFAGDVQKHKTHDEEENENNAKEYDSQSALEQLTPKTMMFFFAISALLAVLITFFWCSISDSPSCPTRGYFYTKLKFFYYKYLVTSDPDVNYL